MANGQLISVPTRRHGGLASRSVVFCTALATAVTLAVFLGLASSVVASSDVVGAPAPQVVNAATADQSLKVPPGPHLSGLRGADDTATPGPHLSGLRGSHAAVVPSDGGGFPFGAAAIGSAVALGLLGFIGLAVSRARSRTRTGPAALSQ